jgi:hypothetical protein
LTSEIRRFIRVTVATAKSVVENPDEPTDPVRGGGFADWAMLTRHSLRIELGKSYRQTIDLLSGIPGVLDGIGLTRLPHFTILRNWFEKLLTPLWRAFLRAYGVRPLIEHRIYSSLDLAHNARMNSTHYNRRWMVETAFSSIKRTLGSTVRARSWHLELRDDPQMCRLQPPLEREVS